MATQPFQVPDRFNAATFFVDRNVAERCHLAVLDFDHEYQPERSHDDLDRNQPGDRHPEGRTRNIVQPDPVAEIDGFRISAVFSANSHLKVGFD